MPYRTLSLLAACGCIFLFAGLASADVDNTTIMILPSTSAAAPPPSIFFPGYDAIYAIDVNPNKFHSDYASNGLGNATHLDLNFGAPLTFSQILYTDRVTSGGANGCPPGYFPNGCSFGTTDFSTSYEYIFSSDPTFTTVVGMITDSHAPPVGPTSYLDFQKATAIPSITAQYVRFQVLTVNGGNTGTSPGAADFEFTVTPGPSTVGLLGLGILAIIAFSRRRQRA